MTGEVIPEKDSAKRAVVARSWYQKPIPTLIVALRNPPRDEEAAGRNRPTHETSGEGLEDH